MQRYMVVFAAMALLLTSAFRAPAELEHRVGGGMNYWFNVDDSDETFVDESGYSFLISYQARLSFLVKLQADLELLPEYYGGYQADVFAPQVYALLGNAIYGGLGIGILYADGDFADSPYYVLRVGADLEVLPRIHLDLNANYRFLEWDQLKEFERDLDTDVIALGVAVRLEL